MLHSEKVMSINYACRHDNSGDAIHTLMCDENSNELEMRNFSMIPGVHYTFPDLSQVFMFLRFGTAKEYFKIEEDEIDEVYNSDEYNYFTIKKNLNK